MNHHQANELLRNALAHAESVYRLNVVKDGESSSTLENMQRVLAMTADYCPAPASEPAVDRDAGPDAEALIKWINAGAFGMESASNRRIMCNHVLRLAAPATPAVQSDAHDLSTTGIDGQNGPNVEHKAVPAAPLVASYGPVDVVADLVRNLLTLDQSLPIYAGLHVTIDGKRRHRTRPVSTSYERIIDGKWIDSSRKDVPYGVIVWAGPAADPEPISPPSPSVDQAKRPVGGDSALLDWLEAWRQDSIKHGFKWDSLSFNMDKTVREQIAIRMDRASTGSATSTDTKGGA